MADVNEAIARSSVSWLKRVEYFDQIESSNSYLLKQSGSIHGRVCVAGFQTQGRGRSGRKWVDNEHKNIALSIGWAPAEGTNNCLSLVVGVAVAEALQGLGVASVGLKWPNDLMAKRLKLGGILVESIRRGSHSQYVIGVGVNRCLSAVSSSDIEQPWTDLTRLGCAFDRTILVSSLLVSIGSCLDEFVQLGWSGFETRWKQLHVFDGEEVDFVIGAESYIGRVQGVDAFGALRVLVDGEVKSFVSGEIKIKY